MPPFFCALRRAGGSVTRAFRRVTAGVAVAATVAAALAGPPASATIAVRSGAEPATSGSVVRTAVLPPETAALPSTLGPAAALFDSPREQDGAAPAGAAKHGRGRRAGASPSANPAGAGSRDRARKLEVGRLGWAAALHAIHAGHSSFHCDTPPPSRV